MPDAGVELQFDVPSAFPSGSVLLTGHYLDNRWAPCQLVSEHSKRDAVVLQAGA